MIESHLACSGDSQLNTSKRVLRSQCMLRTIEQLPSQDFSSLRHMSDQRWLIRNWLKMSHFAQVAPKKSREIQQAVASSISLGLIGRKTGVAASDSSAVTRVARSGPYFCSASNTVSQS